MSIITRTTCSNGGESNGEEQATTAAGAPWEILGEDLIRPLGLSINRLACELSVPVTRMSEIVNGRRSTTADTALRLARYLAMTPQFWMNLQAAFDLDVATRASADRIKRDVHPREAA